MKAFLMRISIFLFPVVAGLLLMEFLLRHVPNEYSYKNNYLEKYANEMEVLFLGSSHTYYGLNPAFSQWKSFNAGYVSQTIDLDLEILKKYENKWSSLRAIVLPLSHFTLYGKLQNSVEAWRIKNYTIYYGLQVSPLFSDYTEVLSGKFSVNLRRLGSYYLKGNPMVKCSEKGWGLGYDSANRQDLQRSGIRSANFHNVPDIDCFNESVATLHEIARFAEKYGVKLYLITPPAYQSYTERLNRTQLNRTIETAQSVARHYKGCSYTNLLESDLFTEVDFYDADHLNEIGARKLTILLDKVIAGNRLTNLVPARAD